MGFRLKADGGTEFVNDKATHLYADCRVPGPPDSIMETPILALGKTQQKIIYSVCACFFPGAQQGGGFGPGFADSIEEVMINRILPKRRLSENDKKYFSKSELDVLETVCMRFGTKNTKYIEDVSHEEAPWKMTSLLDNIPYTLAINDKDCVVSKEEIELFSKIYPN